jgi:chitosanase
LPHGYTVQAPARPADAAPDIGLTQGGDMAVLRKVIGTAVTGTTLAIPLVMAMTGTASAATDGKLSEGRPVTASSTKAGTAAASAVDGDTSTRWAGAANAGPQWLRVDLGAASAISRVKLNWDKTYAADYRIEASADGTSWTTLYRTATGNGGTDDLTVLGGTGRYVRVNATAAKSAKGMALLEIKVYGHRLESTTPAPAPPTTAPPSSPSTNKDLFESHRKDVAMQLVSSAENSSLNWKAQYGYIEDIGDGRGYTGGIIGFCSGTSDMLAVVEAYTAKVPGNVLAKYLPALRAVNGSESHAGLEAGFVAAWKAAAGDLAFQQAQDAERDGVYFNPAVNQAKADGLRALGQFAYYDAMVMHGPGSDAASFGGIRKAAMAKAKTPAQGGDEKTYVSAFLDARKAAMVKEEAHSDTTRVDTAQRVFLTNGNLDLNTPLTWKVYGDSYSIVA